MQYNKSKNNARKLSTASWICYLAFMLIVPAPSFAQDIANLHFEKVLDDGLSNNYITCINQDKDGFIWFGTGEGLFQV
jgi:ligand-binding sensor domain-containing protein